MYPPSDLVLKGEEVFGVTILFFLFLFCFSFFGLGGGIQFEQKRSYFIGAEEARES